MIDSIDHDCEKCVFGLFKQFQPRWIPVTERLPEEGQRVLGQFDDGYLWTINYSSVGITSHIVAWMPLPEPYREECGDE